MAINRRQFLRKSAITAVGFGLAGPLCSGSVFGATRRTAKGAAAAASDKILVVLNLYGGNDVLNTVVPIFQFD